MLIGRKVIGTVSFMGGVPTVPIPFTKAWGDMIQYNYEYLLQPDERILYNHSTVSYHSFARDGLIDDMRGDWILMLDADVVFPPDIVGQMLHKLEIHKVDVLLAPYPYKGSLHAPVLYGWDPKKKKRFVLGNWQKDADIIKCDGGGAGCLMIRRSVVEKIKQKKKTSLFAIKEPFSEDNSFFIRCRELGIDVFFTPTISVNHLVFQELSLEKDFPESLRKRITKRENDTIAMKIT